MLGASNFYGALAPFRGMHIVIACISTSLLTYCASTASEVSGEGLSLGGNGPVTELTSFPTSGCVAGVVAGAEAKVESISAIRVIYFDVEDANGNVVHTQTEWASKYCFAGGGSDKPCQPWDSADYPDGDYELKVRAVKKNGTQTTQSIPLIIDNTNACASGGEPSPPEDIPRDAPRGAPGSRDALKWPFAVDSPWNLPIHSSARYVHGRIPETNGFGVDEDYIVMAPDAPIISVFKSDAGWKRSGNRCIKPSGNPATLARVPMPRAWEIRPGAWNGERPNAGTGILMPDRETIVQMQPFARCNAGGFGTTKVRAPDANIYGKGIRGAHGGSGLSSIGGAIRCGEFEAGEIRHAMKINLFGREAISRTGNGYRWPAVKADSGYSDASASNYYNGRVAALRMGALLAVRPQDYASLVDSFETGKGANSPGVILARAFRDYGAYVVDNTAWDHVDIVTEWGPTCRVRDDFKSKYGYPIKGGNSTKWGRDLNRLLKVLHVVDSNSESNPGGGPFNPNGSGRRAPLAPNFSR